MEYRRSGGSILRKARQTTFPRIFQTKVRSRKTEQPLTGALVVQCFNSYCRFLYDVLMMPRCNLCVFAMICVRYYQNCSSEVPPMVGTDGQQRSRSLVTGWSGTSSKCLKWTRTRRRPTWRISDRFMARIVTLLLLIHWVTPACTQEF
jgi:hypothetical protein